MRAAASELYAVFSSFAGSGRLQRAHSVHEAPFRSARSTGIGCEQVHVVVIGVHRA